MSDYAKQNNFSAKDDLPVGSGGDKLILGEEWDEEFAAISTAIATKYDSNDIASTGEAQTGTDNTKLMSPLKCTNLLQARASASQDLFERSQVGKFLSSLEGPFASFSQSSVLTGWNLDANAWYLVTGTLGLLVSPTVSCYIGFYFSNTPQVVKSVFLPTGAEFAVAGAYLTAANTETAMLGLDNGFAARHEVHGIFKTHATTGGTFGIMAGPNAGNNPSMIGDSHIILKRIYM